MAPNRTSYEQRLFISFSRDKKVLIWHTTIVMLLIWRVSDTIVSGEVHGEFSHTLVRRIEYARRLQSMCLDIAAL